MLAEEDKKEIQYLIETFIQKMNEWEKACEQISRNPILSCQEHFQIQQVLVLEIFKEYCTHKERKFGRPTTISYGHQGSYIYEPNREKLLTIEETNSKNKAIVFTQTLEGPLPSKYQYVVEKKKEKWLLDSKKRYSPWREKWLVESL